MKRLNKVAFLLVFLVSLLIGSVFASENEYILTREYSYKNEGKNQLASGFVEISIGSGDFTQYQDDEYLSISPIPDEIREDEYGNKYAYFDLSGLAAGSKFNIVVKRRVTAGTYLEEIPARTNTELNIENEMYLLPQEKVDSEDDEIISKAKELTEDIPSDYKKAQAIFEYINVNMTYDTSVAYANKGSVSALKNMRGVCEEFTTLFVAMCRAVDIPSRAVVGYWIQSEEVEVSGEMIEEKQIVNHVWAEIYLQDFGWVPVELSIIYTEGSKRVAYTDAFCKMESPEHIATGIYNYNDEIADRMYDDALKEVQYVEKLEEIDDTQIKLENNFSDIEAYDWAEGAIQFLYEKGIVNGYSETEYGPQRNISRIEFITMLSRTLKYKETMYDERGSVYYYLDYDQEHWSKEEYDYLMRCYQAITPSDIASAGFYNIVEVFGEGKFDMNKPITRAEVVALMDIFLSEDNTSSKLKDISGHKFESSIIKSYNSGLIVGYPDMTFRPNNSITRAEMAVILERYIGNEIFYFITGEDNV